MNLSHLPNIISGVRLLLVPPTMWCIVAGEYSLALGLVVVAALSDGLDGFLARHFSWQSRLGGLIDPLADKLLLGGVFLALAFVGRLPWWLFGLMVARDLVIVSGATAYRLMLGPFAAEPLALSKVNTVLQLLLALVLLLPWPDEAVASAQVEGLVVLIVVTTVASGVSYVFQWSRYAAAGFRAGQPPGTRQ